MNGDPLRASDRSEPTERIASGVLDDLSRTRGDQPAMTSSPEAGSAMVSTGTAPERMRTSLTDS